VSNLPSTQPRSAAPHASQAPASSQSDESFSGGQRVVVGLIGIALIGLCVGTWLSPDLLSAIDPSNFSGRGGRRIATLITYLWWRPVGTIAGVIGLLAAFTAIVGGKKDDRPAGAAGASGAEPLS